MSFSLDIKKELCEYASYKYEPHRYEPVKARHCCIAEILAIINSCGHRMYEDTNSICFKIQTENVNLARKVYVLIKDTFSYSCDVSVKKNRLLTYTVAVNDSAAAKKILNATGILDKYSGNIDFKKITPIIVSSGCCKRAYIRGSFIASGSVSDPEKSYHLEFVGQEKALSVQLSQMINSFGLNSKIVKRKEHYIVYLKESENIVDMLNIMEAHRALLRMENIIILKDMRNNVNRFVNCETANLTKIVNASVNQIEDIKYIEKKVGLSFLSEQLEDVARLRLLYEQASLKEIGALLSPPVSKSGVNHRLKKISEIAENLRGDKPC